MFAGHVGIGFGLGKVERRVSVGRFVTCALARDFLLWLTTTWTTRR